MHEQNDVSTIETSVPDLPKQKSADELIERYWRWTKKSAQAVVEKASAFFDADNLSDEGEVERFYREVGYSRDDSTSKKYRSIGSRRSRFIQHLDILPDDWTTIYELAKLEDDQFQKLIDDRVLSPKVTMSAIAKHLAAATSSAALNAGEIASPKRVSFAFDWKKVPSANRAAFAKRLKALLDEFDVVVDNKKRATLEAFIEDDQDDDHA